VPVGGRQQLAQQLLDPPGGADLVARVVAVPCGCAPLTLARDETYLRSSVLPTFGAVPLGRITQSAVQE